MADSSRPGMLPAAAGPPLLCAASSSSAPPAGRFHGSRRKAPWSRLGRDRRPSPCVELASALGSLAPGLGRRQARARGRGRSSRASLVVGCFGEAEETGRALLVQRGGGGWRQPRSAGGCTDDGESGAEDGRNTRDTPEVGDTRRRIGEVRRRRRRRIGRLGFWEGIGRRRCAKLLFHVFTRTRCVG
jgi:hypothetical protein